MVKFVGGVERPEGILDNKGVERWGWCACPACTGKPKVLPRSPPYLHLLGGCVCSSHLNRMSKKSASFVLAALWPSTYTKSTSRSLACCGCAGGHFWHPAA